MKLKRFATYLAILSLLLGSTPAFAQSTTTGALTGTVTQGGVPLPGVTVSATSPRLQGTRTAVTGDSGSYTMPNLPPGDYTVSFELEGLQTSTRQVQVSLAQTARADAELRVAAVSEAITVTAEGAAVAETVQVQTNFTGDVIEELPVGRTLTAVTTLAPGVSTGVNGLSISGGASYDNLYTVNGAVVQENLRGQPHNLFIEDAIQETTIQTAGVSAEFGNFTGGVVNAITKSGGNKFEGSLRDSLTNPSWTEDSPDWYRLSSGAVQVAPRTAITDQISHQYEATLGGPILRDRIWFFLAGRQAETESQLTFASGGGSYTRIVEDERLEGKLTASITPRHNIVASYLEAPVTQSPDCQLGCYDQSSLDPDRQLPNDFMTAFYNGAITNNFFVEAKWSEKTFGFVGSGGEDRDRVTGTPIRLLAPGFAAVTNEPYFCGNCTPEDRNNDTIGLKANYFLSTGRLGSHNIAAGIERWHEVRLANNFQTPSGYVFIAQTLAPSRGANNSPLISVRGGRDYMLNYFIPQLSEGSDLNTDSIFVNDAWDLTDRLNFNLGLRYDQNDSADSAGNVIADDSKLSPRLGAGFDVFGNGRLRFNASYGTYVGRLAETIAGAGSAAGNNAWNGYEYGGPDILNVTPEEAMRQVWAWYDAQGGIDKAKLVSASFPGASRQIRGSLQSPSADEYSFGVSTQIGNGFLRADYIHRDWNDYYGEAANTGLGTVVLPSGSRADVSVVGNTDEFDRVYDGITLQGQYRMWNRVNLGANYTWSELTGNIIGETTGSGPVTGGTSEYYPEYFSFAQNNPVGFLPGDQTHKIRAWASVDFPTFLGNFNVAALQRFDSGEAYSLAGTIDVRSNANFYGTGQAGGVTNPGYITPPTGVTYFFGDRGSERWDDLTATDLALNYDTNPRWLFGAGFFVQAEILNLFNEDAQVSGNTQVVTAVNNAAACSSNPTGTGCLQRFNPLANDVPVEGVHWRRGPLFGLPTAETNANVAGSFQLPRTYRFSAGIRF